jgi:hypothetical protein
MGYGTSMANCGESGIYLGIHRTPSLWGLDRDFERTPLDTPLEASSRQMFSVVDRSRVTERCRGDELGGSKKPKGAMLPR